MSHLQKIKSAFVDVNCLRASLEAFGWTLQEKTKMKTYPSDPLGKKVYDFVAVNPDVDGYDLAFNRNENTKMLDTFGDFYRGSIEQAFGREICELKKMYSKKVFTSEWEAQGYTVFETVDSSGEIMLEAELVS